MSRRTRTIPRDYFEGMYAANRDPWGFATSAYEREKYDATLAGLPRERYASALELGCSIGVFTRRLAERCDRLLAIDVVPAVLDAARERCLDQPHVRFAEHAVPGSWPEGRFDLVVASEVAYYLDREDLRRLAGRVAGALREEGDVVLVHWLGATDYPLTGDEAADGLVEAVCAAPGLACAHRATRTARYRLDVLRTRRSSAP